MVTDSRSAPRHSGSHLRTGSVNASRRPSTARITSVVVAIGFVSDARSKTVSVVVSAESGS